MSTDDKSKSSQSSQSAAQKIRSESFFEETYAILLRCGKKHADIKKEKVEEQVSLIVEALDACHDKMLTYLGKINPLYDQFIICTHVAWPHVVASMRETALNKNDHFHLLHTKNMTERIKGSVELYKETLKKFQQDSRFYYPEIYVMIRFVPMAVEHLITQQKGNAARSHLLIQQVLEDSKITGFGRLSSFINHDVDRIFKKCVTEMPAISFFAVELLTDDQFSRLIDFKYMRCTHESWGWYEKEYCNSEYDKFRDYINIEFRKLLQWPKNMHIIIRINDKEYRKKKQKNPKRGGTQEEEKKSVVE